MARHALVQYYTLIVILKFTRRVSSVVFMEINGYLETSRTSTMKLFFQKQSTVFTVNYFCKKSVIFDSVLNTPLERSKEIYQKTFNFLHKRILGMIKVCIWFQPIPIEYETNIRNAKRRISGTNVTKKHLQYNEK